MNQAQLQSIIGRLSATRAFFYSEADFQHNLANELRKAGYTVFLEYPLGGYHIDIILEDKGMFYPIELKYKTCLTKCFDLFNNIISLKYHGASDLARYSLWKDVYRIEQLKAKYRKERIAEGYVVMLTNDEKLWTPKAQKGIDQKFEVFQCHRVKDVDWVGTDNAPNYKTGRTWYRAFTLGKTYTVSQWNDYSIVVSSGNVKAKKEFKYLIITV